MKKSEEFDVTKRKSKLFEIDFEDEKEVEVFDNTFLKSQGTRGNNSPQVVTSRNNENFLIDFEDEKEVEDF